MRDIGKNIRALRMRKNLSQDQLAQILHVTRQTISNYETGRSQPDMEMLTLLSQALDADQKELLCAPADREARLRRLRRLTVSAVATALAGALDAVGFLWGRHLMEVFYIGRVYYAAVYLLHPLFTLLLGRTLALGLLALLRTDSPEHRWTVWARWCLLATMALFLVPTAPFFLYLADGAFRCLLSQDFSAISVTPTRFLLFVTSHPRALAWGSLLWGGALGLLGRPLRRAGSPSENPDAEKSDSLE